MNPVLKFIVVGLGAGICLMVIAFGFSQWHASRYFDERHARFIREQKPTYDRMAEKVLAQRASLSEQGRDVGDIVPRPFTASARTNRDGSVTIWFPGGEGGPRHGYVYHSGALLTNKPGDPDAYFYHLTNGWYEY